MADATTDTTDAPKGRPWRRAILLAAIASLTAVLGGGVWRGQFETYHLAAVKEGVLYRDGNRGMREFENAVERVEPKTVVALIDDAEIADPRKAMFAEEIQYLERKGVRVERIPVPLGGWPTSGQVRQFLRLVQDRENQPVLVHCAQGVRRTGMMTAAYQQSVLKLDDKVTQGEVLMFGRKETSRSIADLRKFIEAYDESNGMLKAEFSQPSEVQGATVNWDKE